MALQMTIWGAPHQGRRQRWCGWGPFATEVGSAADRLTPRHTISVLRPPCDRTVVTGIAIRRLGRIAAGGVV
jgi:hypothetical protein